MMTTLALAAENMHGQLHGGDCGFDGVSIDTRTLKDGELFVALDGPNFKGSEFLSQAAGKGAAGAVVANGGNYALPHISVADTRLALGALGAAWRREQTAVVVGITGSNGKTTLKEMVAACLAKNGPTLATEGNLNNDIGMPLMLTRIEPSHQYAVIEMGANRGGEIAYLVELAEPDVVAITNAGDAHLEGFGSVEGIAAGKGEILQGKRRPGVAVLNADDRYFGYWSSMAADIDTLSFGLSNSADVWADGIEADANGSSFDLHIESQHVDVHLPLPGVHNVRNACAAAAIAHAVGVAPEFIKVALESLQPVGGRLQAHAGVNGARLFDDSYNANPLSVKAAAEFIASLDGDAWFVFGDMGELGEDSVAIHKETGAAIAAAGVDRLFAVGELARHTCAAFGDGATWFESHDALIDALRVVVGHDHNVLVKGSRFMAMERVVRALRAPKGGEC